MKQKVQGSSTIVDDTLEKKKHLKELVMSKKAKIAEDTNTYLQWKRELEERLDQKPLLLESTG